MELPLKQCMEGQHQLPEQAGTPRTLTQESGQASISQQVAALDKIAEAVTPVRTTPNPLSQHLPSLQEGENTEVKQSLLERRELDAEHFRLQLRKERLHEDDMPQALCSRIHDHLNNWLQPTQNAKEQMLDLLCLEQFISGLPTHWQTQIKRPGLKIQQAVHLATAFQRDRTPPRSSSKNENRDPSMPQLLSKAHCKVKTTEPKESSGRRRRALWPSDSIESSLQCRECGDLGHISGACVEIPTYVRMGTEAPGTLRSSAKLPLIKTFIFLDLETTGLPRDRPKVTELCLVAVHRTSLENPVWDTTTGPPQLPRILDKLCLLVDPAKLVTPKAAEITGLNNRKLLESEKPNFDECTMTLIQDFLQRQAQPVCLVAHNGYGFDFPLLKTELQLQGWELPGPINCLDTMQALKWLHQHPNTNPTGTPGSYSLPSLYKHFYQEEPKDLHSAEGDVLTMLLVFLSKASELLEYAATNASDWTDVQPMYTPAIPQTPKND